MMAEIVNLRKMRKARAKAEAEKQAADNRSAFGRTKAEKTLTRAEKDRAAQRLDAHRLPSSDSKETPE
jgi:hypothetical protein